MKPDVKKIIADIKATKGNRKFCNGLAGTLQDDNYAPSICKYVKTVTPERIDLLIEYAEKLEAEVTDLAVQLANAESKCREQAAESSRVKLVASNLVSEYISNKGTDCEFIACITPSKNTIGTGGVWDMWRLLDLVLQETTATDDFLAEMRASGVDALVERRLTAARLAKEAGHEITARDLEDEAIRARFFAVEIRKGVQS